MAKKTKAEPTKFFGGLTFKQFRNANKNGIELSDIAWAGRLYPRYPLMWKRVNQLIVVLCCLTILSLIVVWASILTRPPALLMAVYPNSQVVCFPRLINLKGQQVQLHKKYMQLCANLDIRSGKMWQTQNRVAKSDNLAVGNFVPSASQNSKVEYKKISEMQEFNVVPEDEGAEPTIPGTGE